MLTAMHGANAYWMPVALTSSAVAAPILFTRLGSLHGAVQRNTRSSANVAGTGYTSWHSRRELENGACLVAPRPTLWGKMVAPYTLLWPWTASMP